MAHKQELLLLAKHFQRVALRPVVLQHRPYVFDAARPDHYTRINNIKLCNTMFNLRQRTRLPGKEEQSSLSDFKNVKLEKRRYCTLQCVR